jgi:hypothetical protein
VLVIIDRALQKEGDPPSVECVLSIPPAMARFFSSALNAVPSLTCS